jgi:hypothetical protein
VHGPQRDDEAADAVKEDEMELCKKPCPRPGCGSKCRKGKGHEHNPTSVLHASHLCANKHGWQ